MHKNISIKKLIHLSVLFLSFSNFSQNTQAQELNNNVAIGAKIGTAGFGIEGRAMIAQNLYGRLGVNYFGYTYKLKGNKKNRL